MNKQLIEMPELFKLRLQDEKDDFINSLMDSLDHLRTFYVKDQDVTTLEKQITALIHLMQGHEF